MRIRCLGMVFFLLTILVCAGPLLIAQEAGPPSATPPFNLIEKGEQLWNESKFAESREALEKALAARPHDPEILWRLARDSYEMADLVPIENRNGRLDLFDEAEAYARKCIEEAPKKGECYFWLGAALGRESTIKGILSSAMKAREISSSLEKSIELGLTYHSASGHIELANAYYALGQLYRITPDSWIASKIAGVRGNIERSVSYLRKAIELEPERLEFNKELGISLVCLGQERNQPEAVQEGMSYLKRVVNVLPVKEPSDEIDKKHTQMLLDDPSLCCDYSRDGQQERDVKKADIH